MALGREPLREVRKASLRVAVGIGMRFTGPCSCVRSLAAAKLRGHGLTVAGTIAPCAWPMPAGELGAAVSPPVAFLRRNDGDAERVFTTGLGEAQA